MPSSSAISHPTSRIAVLDGFRGFAILIVTLYRFAEVAFTSELIGNLPHKLIHIGSAGVDFFFVLSGFLITGILLDAKQQGGSYFGRFYYRRTLRIFPLYFATLAVLLLLLPNALGNRVIVDDLQGNPLHLWIYTVNLDIAWQNAWNYGRLNHFWSLAIEEQFYIVWPLVVFWLVPKKLLRACIVLLGVCALARIGFSIADLGEVAEKNFTLFRLDGLLMGATAALGVRRVSSLSPYYSRFRIGFGALLVLYAGTLLLGKYDFSVRYTVVSAVAAMLLLMTLASPQGAIERRFLENRFLRSLGKYSYAMYVFQNPLIPLLGFVISPASLAALTGSPLAGGFLYVAVMLAITYGLAWVSWHALEKWFFRMRLWYFSHPKPQSSIGATPSEVGLKHREPVERQQPLALAKEGQ